MGQVIMPQLGETVTEGTVARWLKKVGESVAKYEPLLDVETDKVASEIPSPFAGTVAKILAEEGATVPVGAPVCEITETSAAPAGSVTPGGVAMPVSPISAAPQAGDGQAAATPTPAAPEAASPAGNGARYSPAVRKLARTHRIDLGAIKGSGRGGRVTARDVIAHTESGTVAPPGAPPAAAAPAGQTTAAPQAAPAVLAPAPTPAVKPAAVFAAHPQPLPVAPPGPDDTVIRLSQMRKTIAERMVLSKTTIPHAWSMVEADVTKLVKWREKEKAAFKAREGVNLTFLPIMIQAVCGALREFPMVNAVWAGDSIIQRKHINIGVAVDIEDGLIVPVVRDADRYSLAGLAATVNDLVEKARSRKLTMDDLIDGTITVDNTGSLGSIASVPIINPPQAAIITMEAIVKRPWVVEDAIVIRSIMNVCLCLDHRVLDGAVASHFLQAVRRRLEEFSA
ncbi:MAG TPA: dihydrolipoamide acetyltransferase family protein [Candidatus Tumulicola sp.]|nr:dihydrolipoamide acetyltransferase family protein [Candidatus Tumulicola sp.]